MKIILIDDEPAAVDNLAILLKATKVAHQIVATANGVLSGIKALQNNPVDVVFLDISMADGTGFDILEAIPNRTFETIFVTAHNDKTIQAIRNKAFDYLIKPIDIDELQKAMHRYQSVKRTKTPALNTKQKIAFNTATEMIYLYASDIVYCKSQNNYTEVHTVDKKMYFVSKTLKSVAALLSGHGFFRCHQSYLINLQKIERFLKRDNYLILESNIKIPVSSRNRSRFI